MNPKKQLKNCVCVDKDSRLLCYVTAHRIHIWYIYLHLVDFVRFSCRYIYTSPMDPIGNTHGSGIFSSQILSTVPPRKFAHRRVLKDQGRLTTWGCQKKMGAKPRGKNVHIPFRIIGPSKLASFWGPGDPAKSRFKPFHWRIQGP